MNELASTNYDPPRPESSQVATRAQQLYPERQGAYSDDGYGDEGKIDLRQLLIAAYRHRFLMLAVFATSLLVGIGITLLMTRIYSATSSVQIDQQMVNVLGQDGVQQAVPMSDANRFLQTQLDVLRSRALASRVSDKLGLAHDNSFLLAMHAKPILRQDAAGQAARSEAVTDVIQDNLTIDLPINTRVARITFNSPDPDVAMRVANQVAQSFIVDNMERRFNTTSYARNYLSQQLDTTQQKLEDSEKALLAYARSAGLIDTNAVGTAGAGPDSSGNGNGGGGGSGSSIGSLTASNLVQVNTAATTAHTDTLAAKAKWDQARTTPLLQLPDVLANPSIQGLLQTRAGLQASYEEGLQRRQADFPEMIQAKARIAELDRQINVQAQAVRDSIREQYETAAKNEQQLNGSVAQLKLSTMAEQDKGIRYNILKREADTNRGMYDALLQRFKEVTAEQGMTSSNISIVDQATRPGAPVSPKVMKNIALAAFVGLALAIGLAFLREVMDDRMRSGEDVQRKLHLPFLGAVPLLPTGETVSTALADPRSSFSEAHYALQSLLEFSTSEGAPRSILITSSQPGEGKSTCAMATARAFAMVGKRTLLIDGDLRKPTIHKQLSLTQKQGLSSLLSGQASFDDAVQSTAQFNLFALPCGPIPPNPATLLASKRLEQVIALAMTKYDVVVIDGPPVAGLADVLMLASLVQGTIFVAEAGRAHLGAAKSAIARLRATADNIIGVVLTKFDAKKYGYGDYYGDYYYSYGSSDQDD